MQVVNYYSEKVYQIPDYMIQLNPCTKHKRITVAIMMGGK